MQNFPRSSLCQLETVTGAVLARYQRMVSHPGYASHTSDYLAWLHRTVEAQRQANFKRETERLAAKRAALVLELGQVG